MPLPLLPILAVTALGGAGYAAHKRAKSRKLNKKHQQVFDKAYQTLKPPDQLRKLAAAFRKSGHKHHAKLLEQRAALREMTPEQKAHNKLIIRKAFSSKNPGAIRNVARTFKKMGALGTYHNLMRQADRVEKALGIKRAAHKRRPPALHSSV